MTDRPTNAPRGLEDVLREHWPTRAPISGNWDCSCGATATPLQRGDDYPTVRARRDVEWRAHVATAIREWLTSEAVVEAAAEGVVEQIGQTPFGEYPADNELARAALAAAAGVA